MLRKMPGVNDEEVKKLLAKFTPDQRGVAITLATLKVENQALRKQVEALGRDHKQLFRILLTILDVMKSEGMSEMRIHDSQFMRLVESWRIDQRYDRETNELVLRLLTITDDVPDGAGDDETTH